MFEKIVVGLDGSETSDKALRTACDLAQKYGSEIHLVHTPQPKTVAFAMGAVAGYHTVTTMPNDEEVTKAANMIIGRGKGIAQDYDLSAVKTYSHRGDPVEEIVACAEGCDADLIVTGRRGLGSLGALIQGSTAQGVAHNAKCACLTVA
ncbi:universal stress protein [Cognatishimia activa]|uniref:universal stress protein n=1 Tax=Cognatishimia activa TaxID=1715691 RepID=UPI00222E6507|nr:universal stress protein [Cognatishimia activa]UZD91978.1 universal stress protein [Cognatishimia activa]